MSGLHTKDNGMKRINEHWVNEDEIELVDPLAHMGGCPPDPSEGGLTESLMSIPSKNFGDSGNDEAREIEDEPDEEARRRADVEVAEATREAPEKVVIETPMDA